jgi:hypothetical protein
MHHLAWMVSLKIANAQTALLDCGTGTMTCDLYLCEAESRYSRYRLGGPMRAKHGHLRGSTTAVSGAGIWLGPSSAGVETPQTKTKRQRSETYQIKQINWHDASSTINPRRSPILIQNANGPCPLLALVNALIISTPATPPRRSWRH